MFFAFLILLCPLCPSAVGAPRSSTLCLQDKAKYFDLAKRIKDPSPDVRREAVEGLQQLGTPDAWSFVLDALEDPSAMVADEAQKQLSQLGSEDVLRKLFTPIGMKSGNEWKRRRIAESFGRMGSIVDPMELIGCLQDKDAETRRMLLWSLERLERRDKLEFVEFGGVKPEAMRATLIQLLGAIAVGGDKDINVRGAALMALQAIAPEAAKAVVRGVRRESGEPMRGIALTVALEASTFERFNLGVQFRNDPDPTVRAGAIDLLGAAGSQSACRQLLERIETEANSRLRWRAVLNLQQLSGLDVGVDAGAWKQWIDGLAASWQPSERNPKPLSPNSATNLKTVFGLPILSDHVAILVDCSEYLWKPATDGKTWKEKLDSELQTLFANLDPATKFNLIPFAKEPTPWKKALVPATKGNVAQALDFWSKCRLNGPSNLWGALEQAWIDPEVDTIVVVTHTMPTGGHHWSLYVIGDLLVEKNRFRHVAIDAVLIDASKGFKERWERICSGNAGILRTVDMK